LEVWGGLIKSRLLQIRKNLEILNFRFIKEAKDPNVEDEAKW
jgi:hypothetical protein